MSLNVKIPSKSLVFRPTARFVATYNVPTPGKYDFTNEGAPNFVNVNVPLMALKRQSIYLIDRWTFNTTVSTDLYQQGISTNPNPQIRLKLIRKSDTIITQTAWDVDAEVSDEEIMVWFHTDQDEDQLVASFEGQLDQVGDLINFSEILASLKLNVYQISNRAWVEKYQQGTHEAIGRELIR